MKVLSTFFFSFELHSSHHLYTGFFIFIATKVYAKTRCSVYLTLMNLYNDYKNDYVYIRGKPRGRTAVLASRYCSVEM